MSDNHQPPLELLPGFTLTERLGAGGYGEVWKATAPGGLEKAVKYVFGQHGESRATSEMKAMERIKSVRHPFLLSLERIEIVDGRLIVVTELADGSLRDRYHACIQEGLPGIPRDELLNYLKDTADALDFLSDLHDLQHLDIKPENLLLLAGHVKVADFGLVKSISNHTQSLVGGMTPTYAAPEVFQGTPSKHSDQYSLAIMYQELLSGTVPFPGSNAAELTMQHLNEQPNLNTLNESDRFAISRALSKDPTYRFDSCGDLVQALIDGPRILHDEQETVGTPQIATQRRSTRPTLEKSAKTYSATEVFEENTETEAAVQPSMLIDLPEAADQDLTEVAVPDTDATHFTPTPALFIGIGRTAGLVLKGLKSRIAAECEGHHSVPTLQMLLLDSNARDLQAATRGGELGQGLRREETVPLPLRRPQGYRDKASDVLTWLGRRWLYNIPKSLETEGIRPLGRLALIDHARQAFQRIRRAMTECVSEENITAAIEKTGKQFRHKQLRVYIVSSISGGTGSGMVLDVAYAAKSILKKLDLERSQVVGIMMHSTNRDARRRELSRVNAYACLSEFRHFGLPGSAYPGDQGCGLPAHEEGEAAFDHGYFVDLGDGLDAIALDSAAQTVSDYLMLDAISPAQLVLDKCRQKVSDDSPFPGIRSFAIRREESIPERTVKALQQEVAISLLREWAGDSTATSEDNQSAKSTVLRSTNPLVPGAAQLTKKLKLDAAGLASLGRSLIEAQLGGGVEQIECLNRDATIDVPANIERLVAPIARLFGDWRIGEIPSEPITCVGGLNVDQLVDPLRAKLSSDLTKCISSRINEPNERVGGALRAINWYGEHLTHVLADLNNLQEITELQMAQSLEAAGSIDWDQSAADAAGAWQTQHGKKVFDFAAVSAAKTILAGLQDDLKQFTKQVRELQQKLLALSSELDSKTIEEELTPDESWSGLITKCIEPALVELRGRLESEFLRPRGGLHNLLSNDEGAALLADAIERASQQVAAGQLSRIAQNVPSEGVATDPSEILPKHAERGRSVTRFVACPSDRVAGDTAKTGESEDTRVQGPNGASYHVAEVDGLNLPLVAADLIGRRRDYAEFAARVHTRQDVSWTDILETNPQPVPIASSNPVACVRNTCELTSPVPT